VTIFECERQAQELSPSRVDENTYVWFDLRVGTRTTAVYWLDPYMGLLCIPGTGGFTLMSDLQTHLEGSDYSCDALRLQHVANPGT